MFKSYEFYCSIYNAVVFLDFSREERDKLKNGRISSCHLVYNKEANRLEAPVPLFCVANSHLPVMSTFDNSKINSFPEVDTLLR